jgi:O-antigen/teichoic acid export membrane protein
MSTTTLARSATKRRAGRDIFMQVGVRVINLAIGVVVTALVARTLGRVGYGQWSTIFVVLTLVGYFVNFGTETVAMREAARDPEHEHEWLGAATMVRLIALGPVIVVSIAAIVLLHRSQQMLVAGLILVLTMPFNGAGALQLIFRLRVNNFVPMLVLTLRSVLWGGAAALIYVRGGGMVAFAIAMTLTTAVGTIVQSVSALRLVDRWPRPSTKRLAQLMRDSIPIGLAWTLVIAYARIDQLLVYTIAGSKSAGLYGAAYNVLDQSHFVPISIMTTLAPVIAASWPSDRRRLLRTSRLTAELMAITSFGALAFVIVAATPFMRAIFGVPFVPAAPALPVLGAAFIFICFDYLNSNLLVVIGMQRRLAIISLVALVVNVAGNFVAIPLFGFMGAAWMTLLTEMVVFVASGLLVLSRLSLPLPGLGRIGRTLLAAVLLGGILGLLKLADQPLSVLVLAACICYPLLLFGLRAVSVEDLRLLLRREQPA